MRCSNIKVLGLVAFLSGIMQVSAQNSYTVSQLREDFGIFKQALQEAHPGLYRYNSKASIDSLFSITEERIDHNMTQQDFYRLLLPFVAQIRCGHTKLHPDNNWTDNFFYSTNKVFPLRLFFRDNRAWVTGSYDSSLTVPLGLEVLTINGKPVAGLVEELLPRFFSDGNSKTFQYIEMSHYFSAYYANLYESPDSFRLVCSEGKNQVTLTLPAIDKSAIDRYEKQAGIGPPYSLTYPSEKTALLTIASFWMEAPGEPYKQFLKHSFEEIKARGIQDLIIDVRDNEGGNDARGSLLLSYLMDKEFRYYDRLETTTDKKYSFADYARLPRFYGILRLLISRTKDGHYVWKHNSNLKVQKPRKHPYSGKVYVLINGASFSVTAEFAAVTHYLRRATFIGEETGGGYYGNNSGAFVIVTLPNSRLNLGIPMLAYYTAVSDYPHADRGILPDHEVRPGIRDILEGNDPVLEYTLLLIRQQ
jgi:hypothetical protein